MYKLAVGHTADGGNVKAGAFRNVFQDHGPQGSFITGEEELALVFHDGLHSAEQGVLPLLDGINEPFGRVYFLFDEEHRLFLAFVFFAAALIIFQHFPVALANAQVGCVFAVKGQFQLTIIIYNEKILEKVNKSGNLLKKCLIEIKNKDTQIIDVRGLGLMLGVEFQKKEIRNKEIKKLFQNKLLVIPSGLKTIRILPPLVITDEEIFKGMVIFEKVLKEINH